MSSLKYLLAPRSVAIIGASADPKKTSGRPVTYLLKHGFKGKIFPVNPKVDVISDLPCFAAISALPQAPDVAIVLLAASRVAGAVAELAAMGTQYAIILASGFGETGPKGQALQEELLASAGKMRLLGPNTIGLVNVTDGISLSASAALEADKQQTGGIALVSQSGGILGAILSRGVAQGLGFSKLISTSNEVDLEIADFVSALVEDEATRVIALYVETIRDPEKFRIACLKAHAAGKAIIAYKVGRSEEGARAAVSHTGAMAGSDAAYDAFFKANGVVRAESFSDLLDLSDTLQSRRRLSGKRMAVLTSTGGAGTLIADNLGFQGFETPAPGSATATALRALQKGDEAILDRNPIDVTLAGLDPLLLRAIIGVLQDSDDYDGLVVVVGSSSLAMPDLVADAIRDCLPRSDKPILAFVSPHAPHVVQVLRAREVPTFTAPESCAIACKALLCADQALPAMARLSDHIEINEAYHGTLNEKQAADLMSTFGIPMAPSWVVATAAQASALCQTLSRPVVLKILSDQITHKSDIGGVVMHQSAETVGPSLDLMREQILRTTGLKIDQFLIQTQVQAPVSLILGARKDPLGMTIMVGAGGVLAELLQDSAVTILAKDQVLSKKQALELLKQLKIWPLLMGYRGKPSMDIDVLVCTLEMFSKMVGQLSSCLIEAEINPLLVQHAGLGVAGVDAVMRFDEDKRLTDRHSAF